MKKSIIILCLPLLILACDSRDSKPRELASATPEKETHVIPQNPSEVEPGPQEEKEQREITITDEFMDILNTHRVSIGLKPLTYAAEIEITAQNHARRMARKFLPFGHLGSKMRCRAVLSALGLKNGSLCGENVAMGQETAQEAFDSWINSPDHREAIEDERYTHTGLGYYEDFRGSIYWAQIFVEAN